VSIYGNDLRPLETDKVRSISIKDRMSKVSTGDFARPVRESASIEDFLSSLPDILAVRSLRSLAGEIVKARALGKPIIWGIGGHVIKTGLAPILIDLMERGFVSAIAANGSVLVHDTEIAMAGTTSEDVDSTLTDGSFGAVEETCQLLNSAATQAARDNIGLGEALGRTLLHSKPHYPQLSLLCSAYRHKIPFTAHVSIGADISHFHPSALGEDIGKSTHTDFKLLAEIVRRMDRGGVYLNVGSAVVLPEVFLKCVTLVRNLGHPLTDFTTANLDFIQSYRPLTNVVRRPVSGSGRGYTLTGHHELMIPLLAAQIINSKS
jgi:hypothetical protein